VGAVTDPTLGPWRQIARSGLERFETHGDVDAVHLADAVFSDWNITIDPELLAEGEAAVQQEITRQMCQGAINAVGGVLACVDGYVRKRYGDQAAEDLVAAVRAAVVKSG
jgi:hypothetical protein